MAGGLFGAAHQQSRINTASADASSARDRVQRLESEVTSLSRRLGRLSLASQALWELLRDHTDFEEAHLVSKMEEIDMRDGLKDGKIGHQPMPCPACGRMANSQRTTCVYCGVELARPHLFE